MAHFLPPEHVRQVNKLEWPKVKKKKKDFLGFPGTIGKGRESYKIKSRIPRNF